MTAPTVTNTFTNGTTADATAVNQNFTDLVNAMTDGTKTFSIDALTCAGAATFNGAVNLGNATGDDITVTGYLASDLLPKTDATYDLGSSGKQWCDLYTKGTTSLDGAVTINDSGANVDFRVEGDTNANLLFCDASTDQVGIGTNAPGCKLQIKGDNTATGGLRISRGDEDSNSHFDIAEYDGLSVFNSRRSDATLANGRSVYFQNIGSDGTRTNMVIQGTTGNVGIGTTNPSVLLHVNGGNTLSSGGYYVGTVSDNKIIDDASNGTGTTTLYIGNASINVTSDRRIKENIEPSKLNAVETINKFNVVDFNWNDPTDLSYNNRNARGKWTGIIAQEAVLHYPSMVNAPRKESDLSIDWESEDRWHLDTGAALGLLIKAIQEQQAFIEHLKLEIAELKNT